MIKPSIQTLQSILVTDSLLSTFSFGAIDVYSGIQPNDGGGPPNGNFLGRITFGGDPWAEGSSSGGLIFDIDGPPLRIIKPSHALWVLTAERSGRAGWFRLRSNQSEAVCIDGSITPPFEELFIGEDQLEQGERR